MKTGFPREMGVVARIFGNLYRGISVTIINAGIDRVRARGWSGPADVS
jgi:hypothetical protein